MRLIKEKDGLVSAWDWKYIFKSNAIDTEGYIETNYHAAYMEDLEYKGYSTMNNSEQNPDKNKEFYI
jgi:hypothetical protein